jgi:hypothetical protein
MRRRFVADASWPSTAVYRSRSSELVSSPGASAKPTFVYDSFARRRPRAASTIGRLGIDTPDRLCPDGHRPAAEIASNQPNREDPG